MSDEPVKKTRRKVSGKDDAEATPGGGGKGKTIIIAAGVAAAMLGLGLGVGYFVGGAVAPGSAPVVVDSDGKPAVGTEEEPVEKRYYLYSSVGKLQAALDYNGATRYVQAEVDLATYDKDAMDSINYDMPAVRSRLLMLLSQQDFAALKTVEGKEELLKDIVDAVNEELGLTVDNGVVKAFFPAFVIQ